MVKKMNSGFYKCEVCGDKYSVHRKAKNHEMLCGIDTISAYYSGVENIWNLDIPENDQSKTEDSTRQLQIGEKFLGYCSRCDNRMTSKDGFKEDKQLFECPSCGKINRFEE